MMQPGPLETRNQQNRTSRPSFLTQCSIATTHFVDMVPDTALQYHSRNNGIWYGCRVTHCCENSVVSYHCIYRERTHDIMRKVCTQSKCNLRFMRHQNHAISISLLRGSTIVVGVGRDSRYFL